MVEITATTSSAYPVGMRFYVAGVYSPRSVFARTWENYLARLALSGSGRPWGEGVEVKPADGALLEEIGNGCVHPSLVAEPGPEAVVSG